MVNFCCDCMFFLVSCLDGGVFLKGDFMFVVFILLLFFFNLLILV